MEKKKKERLRISFVTVDCGIVVAVRLSCFFPFYLSFWCCISSHTQHRDTVQERARSPPSEFFSMEWLNLGWPNSRIFLGGGALWWAERLSPCPPGNRGHAMQFTGGSRATGVLPIWKKKENSAVPRYLHGPHQVKRDMEHFLMSSQRQPFPPSPQSHLPLPHQDPSPRPLRFPDFGGRRKVYLKTAFSSLSYTRTQRWEIK